MNENKLFDDIARTLASPIPRRQAFGHILRGIAGAALVSVFGSGTARAVEIPQNVSAGPVFLRQSLLPERLELLQ